MGADMLIASVRENHEGRTLEELEAIINDLEPAVAEEIYVDVEQANWGELYSEQDETVLEHVQEQLRLAVRAIRGGSREVTYLEHAGANYTVILWLTGGMSWGDHPTEVFGPFLYLAAADIL